MKCELLCTTCTRESLRMFHNAADDYPGEYVRHVAGVLKLDQPPSPVFINGEAQPWSGPCVCDNCNAPIPRGTLATCRTIGRTGDFASWEDEYLADVRP